MAMVVLKTFVAAMRRLESHQVWPLRDLVFLLQSSRPNVAAQDGQGLCLEGCAWHANNLEDEA
jgi:hypothetical protein